MKYFLSFQKSLKKQNGAPAVGIRALHSCASFGRSQGASTSLGFQLTNWGWKHLPHQPFRLRGQIKIQIKCVQVQYKLHSAKDSNNISNIVIFSSYRCLTIYLITVQKNNKRGGSDKSENRICLFGSSLTTHQTHWHVELIAQTFVFEGVTFSPQKIPIRMIGVVLALHSFQKMCAFQPILSLRFLFAYASTISYCSFQLRTLTDTHSLVERPLGSGRDGLKSFAKLGKVIQSL